MTFKKGDIVWLKSGGSAMIITRILYENQQLDRSVPIFCQWHTVLGMPQEKNYYSDLLTNKKPNFENKYEESLAE